TRLAHSTIRRGIRELNSGAVSPGSRERRPGGGRKPIDALDPHIKVSLERLVEPDSRGDPQSPLRWTCKSTRRLAKELTAHGHAVGPTTGGKSAVSSRFQLSPFPPPTSRNPVFSSELLGHQSAQNSKLCGGAGVRCNRGRARRLLIGPQPCAFAWDVHLR